MKFEKLLQKIDFSKCRVNYPFVYDGNRAWFVYESVNGLMEIDYDLDKPFSKQKNKEKIKKYILKK